MTPMEAPGLSAFGLITYVDRWKEVRLGTAPINAPDLINFLRSIRVKIQKSICFIHRSVGI